MSVGQHCRLGRDVFFDTCGGQITLGKHVRINSGCVLVSYSSIIIGDDCLIGEYVSIRDANHGTRAEGLMRLQEHASAPIIIGNNVWIARGSVILKGVTIGNGAVVAANSVVNHDVPPNAVVGGVPARLLKMRSSAATQLASG
jgi:acetyltransferase-like isoleucine patch superfamily enzyme